MHSHAQPLKVEAQLVSATRFKLVICPWTYAESELNAEKGRELQNELIEELKKCGLKPGVDFYYAQPNSIDMIRFARHRALLQQYFIEFSNTATVLHAIKVLPKHFSLRFSHEVNYETMRTSYMLQHNDSEGVMPADLKEILELHQRCYHELSAKVDVAIQTKAGDQHPALVNFQAAKRYIDESIKDDPYLVESSRYSMLMLALWYVVQELADIKPQEANAGFMSIFRKKKAELSPVNQQYKKLLEEYIKHIPTRFTDTNVTSSEELRALYMEKIGKHISGLRPVITK